MKNFFVLTLSVITYITSLSYGAKAADRNLPLTHVRVGSVFSGMPLGDPIEVSDKDTLLSLKKKVAIRKEVPVNLVRLFVGHSVEEFLEKDKTLKEHGITQGQFIGLAIRVPHLLKKSNENLRRAARLGDLKNVKQALDEGAELESAGFWGWTALMKACSRGRFEVVKYLLDEGADLYAADLEGRTVLTMRTVMMHKELRLYLIEWQKNHPKKAPKSVFCFSS